MFIGIFFGIVPGISGITALVILLPFVTSMEPQTALLLFIGVSAVIPTADVIPAILIGVPGTASAAATCIDGYQMARKGQAARAYGAAYTVSAIGGVIGALFLLATIPVMRPLVMSLGSPELLMLALMGLSTVGVISGRLPLIGLALGALGLLLGQIGIDPQTGVHRWSFGILYLTDGLSMQAVVLGLFGVAEIADLAILGSRVSEEIQATGKGLYEGVKDSFRHWGLTLGSSIIGIIVGIIPGIGANVASWLGYAYAAQTSRDKENFGKGDVRGVIGPEAANNSCMGGALLPTLSFGVPGSSEMVLYLAAFAMLGIIPGPLMLTEHLDLVFTIAWGVALANILGCLICMVLTIYLVKLCRVPVRVLAPVVIALIFMGALRISVSFPDLITVIVFGIIGYIFKRLGWPRQSLVLGFVLSPIVGKYLFITVNAYGTTWLMRPWVILIALITIAIAVYGFKARQMAGGRQP
jgi:TctA family transporter